MQTVDEAVDDRAREQLEVADPREDLGSTNRAPGIGTMESIMDGHIPDRGIGTASSSSSMSVSA